MKQIVSFSFLFVLFSISSIGQTDISPTINSETSTHSEINATPDNGIYYIPSMLDTKKMDKLVNQIHIYLATNSKYAAEIYIEDENLKATKITKHLIIDRLSRRGWKNKKDYTISKKRG